MDLPIRPSSLGARPLRQRQHEGIGDLRALADAAAAIEADTALRNPLPAARFRPCLWDHAKAGAATAATPRGQANA